jgi:hypothetical protein
VDLLAAPEAAVQIDPRLAVPNSESGHASAQKCALWRAQQVARPRRRLVVAMLTAVGLLLLLVGATLEIADVTEFVIANLKSQPMPAH